MNPREFHVIKRDTKFKKDWTKVDKFEHMVKDVKSSSNNIDSSWSPRDVIDHRIKQANMINITTKVNPNKIMNWMDST